MTSSLIQSVANSSRAILAVSTASATLWQPAVLVRIRTPSARIISKKVPTAAASDLPLNFHPAAIGPYVRGMKVARPRGKLNRGLLWIGRSLAPCLARANHERR